jgi:coiled-coil domain-containing protein 61
MYWNGVFESRYIEEITNKAGSFKSFHVFIKILMSGLAKESENVLVDLLSYKDLENMRNKKAASQNNNLNESSTLNNTDLSIINKRYLIISYTNEFEKVHFPLPISFLIQPDLSYFLRTIDRLKKSNSKLITNLNLQNVNNSLSISNTNNANNNSIISSSINPVNNYNLNNIINIKDLEEIRNDNQNLKNKIKLLESQRKLGAVENDEFLRNYTGIKEEYDTYKEQAEEKIKLLAKTVEDLKLKINYNIDISADGLDNNNSNNNFNRSERLLKTIVDLESKLEKAEEIVIKERKNAQQYIDEKNREVEKIKKEIFFMKENEKKLKVKINQLEKDLEIANKKTSYSYNNNKTRSVKSDYSYKSSVKSSSIKSSNSSKNSTNSKASNPYDKFKGLYNKQYQPFNFFSKNKAGSKATSITGSYKGSSKGSIYSGNSYGKSNTSINSNKKPPGSKYSGSSNYNIYSKNKTGPGSGIASGSNGSGMGLNNKIYTKGNAANLYKQKASINNNNLKGNNNIYSTGKNPVGIYNKNKNVTSNNTNLNKVNNGVRNININNNNRNNSNLNINLNSNLGINNAKDNKNYILDKQRILGENINSNNINNISTNKIDKNQTNTEEINARLGRIQQLLDTAKI